LVLQYLFFEKTSLGKKMQATAQDKEMARLLGVRVAVMIVITFVYSSMLGAAAGILIGPIFYVSKEMGAMLGLKAFCSTIVGGFGSVPGAILGGLFLGVIEVFCSYYISSAYRDAFAFIILILVLLFRPQGFFGEKIAEKA
jgi:branched-chain amino acid transport system permease protein